jgi:D-alanyl-D-alanine carboxypeptidase
MCTNTQVYTVKELLYAMMLPSGNDASVCLAEVRD